MLRELLGRENIVLATGGGIVMRPENRDLLKQHCVLYLRVPVAEQFRRTRKSREGIRGTVTSLCGSEMTAESTGSGLTL
jgi:shikimate kinase